MDITLTTIIFIVALIVLLKGADIFTFSAEKIGIKLGISEFVIGITIVSIGTSLPELATSIMAGLEKADGIIVGNVFGSNIANILLILGISAMFIKNTKSNINLLNIDLPVMFSSILIVVFLSMDGIFNWFDALIAITGYFFYMEYIYSSRKKIDHNLEKLIEKRKNIKLGVEFLKLIFSLFMVYMGSKFIVSSLIILAANLNIPESIISATTLALGTSLPELAVGLQAARKRKFDMLLGDIMGSNIFNVFVVMAVGALITPITITPFTIKVLIPYAIGSTLLFFMMTQDQQVSKYEGYMLLLLYISYILSIIYWVR